MPHTRQFFCIVGAFENILQTQIIIYTDTQTQTNYFADHFNIYSVRKLGHHENVNVIIKPPIS